LNGVSGFVSGTDNTQLDASLQVKESSHIIVLFMIRPRKNELLITLRNKNDC
jgi:hypothetical protein